MKEELADARGARRVWRTSRASLTPCLRTCPITSVRQYGLRASISSRLLSSATASSTSKRSLPRDASALARENLSKPKMAWSSPSVRCTEASSSVDVA